MLVRLKCPTLQKFTHAHEITSRNVPVHIKPVETAVLTPGPSPTEQSFTYKRRYGDIHQLESCFDSHSFIKTKFENISKSQCGNADFLLPFLEEIIVFFVPFTDNNY